MSGHASTPSASNCDAPTYTNGCNAPLSLERGAKLLVDTSIFIDFLATREPFAKSARLLMLLGKTREYQLWMSNSQVTDLVYLLSQGGQKRLMPQVVACIERLLSFVNVYSPSKEDTLHGLSAGWSDPEDALLHEVALRIDAAAIVTRNLGDFEKSLVPVVDCEAFFKTLEESGVVYEEAAIG